MLIVMAESLTTTPEASSHSGPRPFQFRLTTLFALVTFCGVALGLTRSFSLPGFMIACQLAICFRLAARTSWFVGVGGIVGFALTGDAVLVATESARATDSRLLAVGLLGTWAGWVSAAVHAGLLKYESGRGYFFASLVWLPIVIFFIRAVFDSRVH